MIGERRYRFVLYLAILIAGSATFGVYRVLAAMRNSSRVATRPVFLIRTYSMISQTSRPGCVLNESASGRIAILSSEDGALHLISESRVSE